MCGDFIIYTEILWYNIKFLREKSSQILQVGKHLPLTTPFIPSFIDKKPLANRNNGGKRYFSWCKADYYIENLTWQRNDRVQTECQEIATAGTRISTLSGLVTKVLQQKIYNNWQESQLSSKWRWWRPRIRLKSKYCGLVNAHAYFRSVYKRARLSCGWIRNLLIFSPLKS